MIKKYTIDSSEYSMRIEGQEGPKNGQTGVIEFELIQIPAPDGYWNSTCYLLRQDTDLVNMTREQLTSLKKIINDIV